MDFPQIIEENDTLVILTDVLRELDGLKMNANPEVSFKARRAAVMLSRAIKNITWNSRYEKQNIPVDDKLLEVTKELDGTLITNDVYLKVKATVQNISTSGYGNNSMYTGVRYLTLDLDENKQHKILTDIYETHCIPDEAGLLREGQYLIVQDGTDYKENQYGQVIFATIGIFVVKNNRLEEVTNSHELRIYNNLGVTSKGIGPRNAEQTCLFHALNDRSKTVLYASGGWGKGKSYVLNNFALQELEKGRIKKVIYVPNNSYVENTLEVGTLPGGLIDKVASQIGPLVDLIGIDQVQNLIAQDMLEVVPMACLRGRNFEESIVIVNEAQNLTEDHVKLLIGRIGEGSRIFFDGSLQQVDTLIFKNKNGLKLLLNLSKSPLYSKIFATVELKVTERSFTASAADYLDEIGGSLI